MASELRASRTNDRPLLLLAEEDAGLRRSLQLLLRSRGYNVHAYASGTALLADEEANTACCVVADYHLEGLSGIEILARLRRRGWSGPAVLLTPYCTADIRERADAQGFAHVLEKPIRDYTLGNAVARLTGRA